MSKYIILYTDTAVIEVYTLSEGYNKQSDDVYTLVETLQRAKIMLTFKGINVSMIDELLQ